MIDRRRVSVQWFSGTILTGLCGAALMGGAVFAALDGETNFAAAPEHVEAALRGALGASANASPARARPTGLPPVSESVVARQVIRVPTTQPRRRSRGGARASLRARLRQSVALGLRTLRQHSRRSIRRSCWPTRSAVPTSASDERRMPKPRRRRLRSSRATCAAAATQFAAAEGQAVDAAAARRSRRARARRRQLDRQCRRGHACANADPTAEPASSLMPPKATPDPYAGFEARIVPENVTLLPKTTNQATGGNAWNEHIVMVKKGETVGSILRELGARPTRSRRSSPCSARAAATAASRKARSCASLLMPAGGGPHAAGARDHRRRQRDRGRGRALRPGQIRLGRRAQRRHRGRRASEDERTTTTAAACGSTRASTRRRCATMCRAR